MEGAHLWKSQTASALTLSLPIYSIYPWYRLAVCSTTERNSTRLLWRFDPSSLSHQASIGQLLAVEANETSRPPTFTHGPKAKTQDSQRTNIELHLWLRPPSIAYLPRNSCCWITSATDLNLAIRLRSPQTLGQTVLDLLANFLSTFTLRPSIVSELRFASFYIIAYIPVLMWLINALTLELEYFVGADIPKYAILSHTWEKDEVTFQDAKAKLLDNLRATSQGARKVAKTCELAAEYGLAYAWVDTCCIDKSSSAELTEAINSMFQWYRSSEVCFAYLSDLKTDEDSNLMAKSRWFTRGWTLQELIAPTHLIFCDQSWVERGTKKEFAGLLREITPIDMKVLLDPSKIYTMPVGARMSWAASRETTRIEDRAYSLLGIFDINMPLIYGEGSKAFRRLQEEIIRRSNDVTIFDWLTSEDSCWRGILANSPDEFSISSASCVHRPVLVNGPEYSLTNKGLRIDLNIARVGPNLYLMPLYRTRWEDDVWTCIYLTLIGKNLFARARPQLVALKFRGQLLWDQKQSQYLTVETNSGMSSGVLKSALDRSFTFHGILHTGVGYRIVATYPEHLWQDDQVFLQVGNGPFVGYHAIQARQTHFTILAFGVTMDGDGWLGFVSLNTEEPLSKLQYFICDIVLQAGGLLGWSESDKSKLAEDIAEWGVFLRQTEDRVVAPWGVDTYLTAKLTKCLRDGFTMFDIELREEVNGRSWDDQGNMSGSKDGGRKSMMLIPSYSLFRSSAYPP